MQPSAVSQTKSVCGAALWQGTGVSLLFNRLLLVLAALLVADAALACRCKQQTLGEYIAAADLVFVARAVSSDVAPGEPPYRAVRVEVRGAPYKGDPASVARLATPLSSATCGVPVAAGETYLFFATRREPGADTAWFDTCGGTRRLARETLRPEDGFADVPPGEVLDALARRLAAPRLPTAAPGVRAATTAVLPIPGDPHAELIGLLALPKRAPRLYAAPDAGAAALADAAIATREYAYEEVGAVVRERRPDWYRLALRDGRSAWVRAADAGAFHSLAELLTNRLGYLGAQWDGWVWPASGAGHPVTVPRVAGDEQPVTVIGSEEVGGSLWLQVELLDRSPCDGPGERIIQTGWVPAFTPAGMPVAWFYARGC